MTSLSRDLNETARACCSTKNELLVAMTLSNQTLGYGKISDPLTDKRLAKLTGIRLDRLRPAINAVIATGLFDRKHHKRFGYEYSIGEKFLETHQGKVYTPFISQSSATSEIQNPLMRNNCDLTQMGKDLTEKWAHTTTKPTSLQTQQQTNTNKKTKSSSTQQPQKQTVPLAEQQSVKLFFTDQTQIPQSFAIETSNANTRIEFSFDTPVPAPRKTEITVEPSAITTPKTVKTLKKIMKVVKTENTENIENIEKTEQTKKSTPQKKLPKPRPLQTIPPEEREPWMDDALEAADYLDRKYGKSNTQSLKKAVKQAIEVKKPTPVQQPTLPVCGGDDNKKEEKQDKPKKAAIIPLPTIVGEENYNACNRFFDQLDDEGKKKLLLVFNYNRKTRTINSPAGYFITLAKSAIEGGLTVPPEAIVKQPPTPETIAAAKEKAQHLERWSDFAWLKQNAALQKMPMATLAKQMGQDMEEAYALFAHTLKEDKTE
jgi:hypothetical protein